LTITGTEQNAAAGAVPGTDYEDVPGRAAAWRAEAVAAYADRRPA
jgi:hypothetical protein